jgi:hypothetical protein
VPVLLGEDTNEQSNERDEMSIKKMLLLASMALAAIAFAAPAAAQAEWTHDHEPLSEPATIHFHGDARFFVPFVGSFGCEVHGTMEATPGDEAHVTQFTPYTNTCSGTGALTGCQLEKHSATVPWDAHANTTSGDITVTNATLFNNYVPGSCLFGTETSHLEFDEVTLTPDNADTINSVELSGVDNTLGAEASGTLDVTPAGTYGIA